LALNLNIVLDWSQDHSHGYAWPQVQRLKSTH